VVRAIREQNLQVAAGIIGQPPVPAGNDFQFTINTQGRLLDEQHSEKSSSNKDRKARSRTCAMSRGSSSRRATIPWPRNSAASRPPRSSSSNSRFKRIQTSDAVRAKLEELKATFPPGLDYRVIYDTTISRANRSKQSFTLCSKRCFCGHCRDRLPPKLARVHNSLLAVPCH